LGVARLQRDGATDRAPEVRRRAQWALEPRARHLEQVRAGERLRDLRVAVEHRGQGFGDGRDGVEVDATVSVDQHPQRAGPVGPADLDVVELETEVADDG